MRGSTLFRVLIAGALVAGSFISCSESTMPPGADVIPPAPIRDLAVLTTADSSITLTWTAPGDDGMLGRASHYDVRRSTDGRIVHYWVHATPVDTLLIAREPGVPETLTVGPLVPGSTHHFGVRAVDEAGNLAKGSNVVWTDTGDRTPPNQITDLRVVETLASAVRLEWTAPGDDGYTGFARAYEIRFGRKVSEALWPGLERAANVERPQAPGNLESALVEGLQPPTDFDFGIRTVDDANNWSPVSNITFSPTRVDTLLPGVITDLRPVKSTATSITLEWTAPGDDGSLGTVTAYRLRYAATPIDESTWATAKEAPGPSFPKPVGGLERAIIYYLSPLQTYYFMVRAVDEAGNLSPASNVPSEQTGQSGGQWRVQPDGSGDFPTIQAALDGALEGDLILVAPGTYPECLRFPERDLVLRSEVGPEATIISGCGEPNKQVIYFGSLTTRNTTLEGFTVTGSLGNYAIRIERGSPNLIGNIIRDNPLAGVYIRGGAPVLRDNRFLSNGNPGNWGGGIVASLYYTNYTYDYPHNWSAPLIEGNLFEGNDGRFGGGIYAGYTRAVIRRNVFRNNTCGYDGGAIFLWPTADRVVIEENEFFGNEAGDHGGAIAAWNYQNYQGSGWADIRRNLCVGNIAYGLDSNGNNGIGGTIHVSGLHGTITENTIVGGRGIPLCGGSGITFYLDATDGPWIVERNILAFNSDGGISCVQGDVASVRDNLLFGNTHDFGCGNGRCDSSLVARNIVADPLFCDPDGGDWHLRADSPALSHPAGPMGAYPIPGCNPNP